MSKAKFNAAKELIAEKKYDEARAILKMINHPQAREWEARLDKLSPRKSTTGIRASLLRLGLVTLLFIAVAIFVILRLNFNRGYQEAQQTLDARAAFAAISQLALTSTSPSGLILIPSNTQPATWTFTPAATATSECSVQTWWRSAEPLVTDFLDTGETAASTPRMGLSSVVLQLNTLYRQWDRADYEDCFQDIYFEIRSGMSNVVDGFNAFLAQDEFLPDIDFSIANIHFWQAGHLLNEAGAPGKDYRLSITSIIWGGDKADAAAATRLVNDIATIEATMRSSASNPQNSTSETPEPSGITCLLGQELVKGCQKS